MDQALFQKYQLQTKSKDTEYGELLKQFQEPINESRKGTKHLPINLARIGVGIKNYKKLRGIKTEDYQPIYAFLSICKDSGNRAVKRNERYCDGFSKCYFALIKKI